MKPARGLAFLVSFVFFISLSAFAEAPKSDGVQELMNDTSGRAKIRVDEETGYARFVELPRQSMRPSSINNRAMRSNHRAKEFFRKYSNAFGIENVDSELKEMRTTRDINGNSHTVLAQSYDGVPVFGGELRAHFDQGGELTAANGLFVAGLKVNTTPSVATDMAEGRAIRAVIVEESRRFNASRRADDLFSSFDESRYSDLRAHTSDLVIFREAGAFQIPWPAQQRRSLQYRDVHRGCLVDH